MCFSSERSNITSISIIAVLHSGRKKIMFALHLSVQQISKYSYDSNFYCKLYYKIYKDDVYLRGEKKIFKLFRMKTRNSAQEQSFVITTCTKHRVGTENVLVFFSPAARNVVLWANVVPYTVKLWYDYSLWGFMIK